MKPQLYYIAETDNRKKRIEKLIDSSLLPCLEFPLQCLISQNSQIAGNYRDIKKQALHQGVHETLFEFHLT